MTQLYTQGNPSHSHFSSKMRRAEGLGQPLVELPEPGRKAEKWESQREMVFDGGESGQQRLKTMRSQVRGGQKNVAEVSHIAVSGDLGESCYEFPRKIKTKANKHILRQ